MVYKLENVVKTYGYNKILDNANVNISSKEIVGVIGKNGVGKSTFLKLLSGEENVDTGNLSKNETLKISSLNQSFNNSDDNTTLKYIYRYLNNPTIQKYEIDSILNKFGIFNLDVHFQDLSGGEKRKVDLAIALLEESDVLLLDEPTNHLDGEMILWLENFLKKTKKTIVVISHDRFFLDNICSSIIDIDNSKLFKYEGDFTNALEMRDLRKLDQISANRKLKSKLAVEKAWASRGPQGRGTKSKERLDRYETLKNTKQFTEDKNLEILNISSRLGMDTIEVENLNFSYDENTIISNFNYNFQHYDHIGIVGPNGIGKSTFLNLITKNIKPNSGLVKHGSTVKMAYFTQNAVILNENLKIIDFIKDISDNIQTPEGNLTASTMLDKFLFPPNVQHKYIKTLSGGEKRRLYLLSLLMEQPNVLVLDEPTNDFDVITLEALESLLNQFTGIIITVSHDRYFLKQVANKIFRFVGNGEIEILNDLKIEYIENVEFVDKEKKKKKNIRQKENKPKVKMSFNEKYEWEHIEDKIADLEEKLNQIDNDILLNGNNFEVLDKLIKEREQIQTEYDKTNNRWEYLFELSEL